MEDTLSKLRHDLKTPITSIKWFTEILLSEKDGILNDKQKEYLKEIEKASEDMNNKVDKL